jgi:hypothetical protein
VREQKRRTLAAVARKTPTLFALLFLVVAVLCASWPEKEAPRVEFESTVRPILLARCQPCHFKGGKMYGRLPFDRPETIQKLGTRLFTRIKDEKDRKAIRAFLAMADPKN